MRLTLSSVCYSSSSSSAAALAGLAVAVAGVRRCRVQLEDEEGERGRLERDWAPEETPQRSGTLRTLSSLARSAEVAVGQYLLYMNLGIASYRTSRRWAMTSLSLLEPYWRRNSKFYCQVQKL